MAETFGTASSFTIRELTGEQRTLRLAGRALPYRPVTFSGAMRAEFTWYPGNPEATVQLLGATEDETTINGMWKQRFVGETDGVGNDVQPDAIAELDNVQVGNVPRLAKLVDDFRRKGQLLEVTWDEIVRQGILTRFSQHWDRAQDLAWEAVFQWINQGDKPAPAVLSSSMDIGQMRSSWSKISNAISKAFENPPFGQTPAFAQRIGSVANGVQGAIDGITDAVASVAATASSSLDATKRLSGITQTILDSSTDMIAAIQAQVPMAAFDAFLFNTASFSQELTAITWLRGLENAASQARRQAARQQQELLRRIDPELIGSFVARQGQDLRDVSKAFYGTPNEWRRLLSFNGLTSSGLSAGQVIFAPKLQSVVQAGG